MPDSNQPSRIECGNYSIKVLQGSGTAEQFWYYIVQRKGSNEIIDLVKFDSYEKAMEAARQVLVSMNRAAPAR
ncbi:MAG TPA: hypothetical protein VM912_11655 [Terriglobales bacterium]|nr:hypothetical protein [Terriglobales bacterium]